MGTRPSIGRFTLKAPVGSSMEASSGRFEIEAPVGCLMAASSGRYLTGAPVGCHHKASTPEQTQVPRRPQVPRRRVNNFQLANVMEPQSSPPAPTQAPAPGSNADILVDNSVSNAPATRPASYCAAQGARRQYDCARQAPNPTGYPQAARGLNEPAGGPNLPNWFPEMLPSSVQRALQSQSAHWMLPWSVQRALSGGVGSTLEKIILPRLSSPSSFHLVWTGLKPSIGRFRDASWTLRLDGKQIRPVRGQPRDGSQATKFWTTNGRPEQCKTFQSQFQYGGTGPPEWPTVVLNHQSGHAAALSRQVGHFPTSTTHHTRQPWHGTAKGAKCPPEPPTRPYLPNQWPVYIPAIGRGDLSDQWLVHTGHRAGRPLQSIAGIYRSSGGETSPINSRYIPVIGRGGPLQLMAGTYRSSGGETFLIDDWYVPAIGREDLPDRWPVHTGHWAARPPCSMASTYRSSSRKVSLLDGLFVPAIGWGGAGHRSGRSPQCPVVPANDQEGLPAQWPVCTGHQSARSPRPMANMYRPSIREVSLPDGQYVPANDQGGFPAQWPVCTPAIGESTFSRKPRLYSHLVFVLARLM
ncbi:hypothetical protein PCANC_17746 [Puccinia coronata f. sp. avenae]|uniref:Uncharacterized protein n=1 Tax=Puccinia coronata f. sp. avenae TaxID=200324 RepID=A0A2N5UYQ4_9BASI|nr:hypothetical protein PCANC_17746 [Puccinia coronata f. sp. avenae]